MRRASGPQPPSVIERRGEFVQPASQPFDRPRHRHPRGIGRPLAQHQRDLLVAVAEAQASHHRLAIGLAQFGERLAEERIAFRLEQRFERRRFAVRDRFAGVEVIERRGSAVRRSSSRIRLSTALRR